MKSHVVALCLMAALALPGCKIVKTVAEGEGAAAVAGEAGDDARIAALLDKTYDAELLPLIAKALPVAEFGDFRDQIEFAKLARALNDRASAALVVPKGELVGKTVRYAGTVDLKAAGDAWLVTAVTFAVAP